jgi:hypothetical protein
MSRRKTDHGGNDGALFGRTSNDRSSAGVLFATISKGTTLSAKRTLNIGRSVNYQWRKLNRHTPCPQKQEANWNKQGGGKTVHTLGRQK